MFNLYMIGNSLTDEVLYQGFDALVESQGTTLNWGRHMIPGAPLDWILRNPSAGFQEQPYGYYTQALTTYPWNAVTLQPFDRQLNSDLVSIDQYLDLLEPNSPNAEIFIYAQWPLNDGQNWETQWLREYTGGWDGSQRTKDYYETLTLTLNETDARADFYLIPVGHVMYELHQRMEAGLVPGYTNILQLYSDSIHVNSVGSYVVAATFYATIFRDSPVGLPVPSQYQANASISAELAAIIQDTVWDVVTSTPLSGVTATQPLSVLTATIASAIEDQNYTQTLSAVGGTGTYTWQLAGGNFPQGMTLSPDGVISGAPADPGSFTFTVQVRDSSNAQTTQQFTLISAQDTIPQIATTSLPNGARGSFYQQSLSATGGNGSLSWSLASGALPQGMTLRNDGVLVGTPGLAGTYTFTARVQDSDATPDAQTREFTLTVGAPEANTLLVSRTQEAIAIDGNLSEGVWTLPYTATQQPMGSSTDTVQFGALWDSTHLYVAVQVQDANRQNDSTDPWDDDAIQVLIDARHDREVVFNNDDRQFIVGIDGSLFEPSGRTIGVQRAVQTTAGGYTVELAIPWANLGLTATENLTIGFDLVQDDDDNGGGRDRQLVWQNANVNALAPAQFGNLLLSSDVAVSPVVFPIVNGQTATAFVNASGIVVGAAYQAGQTYAGNLFTNTDGTANPNDVVLGTSGNDNVWIGQTGNDLVVTLAGNDLVGLNAGNASVEMGDGNDFVYSNSGITSTNQIDLGAGDDQVWLPNGNNTVTSNSGNNTLGLGNGTTLATLGAGNDFIYIINGMGGTHTIDVGGGNNQVWLPGGNNTVISSTGNNTIGLGNGQSTLTLGSGNEFIYSINGMGGTHSMNLGAGSNEVWLPRGTHTITAGNGPNTLGVGIGDYTVTTGNGDDFVYTIGGLGGTIRLNLGNGNNGVWLGSGTNTVVTGTGDDVIGIGSGDDLVSAGAGINTIYDVNDGGQDVIVLAANGYAAIYGFTVESDRLSGVTFGEVSVTNGTGNSAGNALISQGGNLIAELFGVQASAIAANTFVPTPSLI